MPLANPSCHTSCRCPRVCLACHGERLASLLETATAFRLYRLTGTAAVEDMAWPMPDEGLPALAALLTGAGVVLLVCGGATCCCLTHFARHGLAVVPWIAGDIPTVLAALRHNRLETLLAPGAHPGRGMARRAGFGKIPLEIKRS